ncbi:MAG: hypothetical protein O4753_11410 [Trichodesmium sp. St7_bin2_1]|nr:hypothetical protein [Trichodesmium sp. St7_bin2_1]
MVKNRKLLTAISEERVEKILEFFSRKNRKVPWRSKSNELLETHIPNWLLL